MSENKIFIKHGIFIYRTNINRIFYRNTTKNLPLPLKFRRLLERKYLQSWRVRKVIRRFNQQIPITVYFEMPLAFTIAHDPETDTWVISIVHPLDAFKRKTGSKIVRERMEFVLEYPNNNKRWSYRLE